MWKKQLIDNFHRNSRPPPAESVPSDLGASTSQSRVVPPCEQTDSVVKEEASSMQTSSSTVMAGGSSAESVPSNLGASTSQSRVVPPCEQTKGVVKEEASSIQNPSSMVMAGGSRSSETSTPAMIIRRQKKKLSSDYTDEEWARHIGGGYQKIPVDSDPNIGLVLKRMYPCEYCGEYMEKAVLVEHTREHVEAGDTKLKYRPCSPKALACYEQCWSHNVSEDHLNVDHRYQKNEFFLPVELPDRCSLLCPYFFKYKRDLTQHIRVHQLFQPKPKVDPNLKREPTE